MLTRRAERILTFGIQQEARRFNSAQIQPEHVLYAIISGGEGAAMSALDFLRLDVSGWKSELESVLLGFEKEDAPEADDTADDAPFASAEILFSPRTANLLWRAMRERESMGHKHLGTEHLLLAACLEEQSHAAAFFGRQRADVNLLRFMVQTSFNHVTLNMLDWPQDAPAGDNSPRSPRVHDGETAADAGASADAETDAGTAADDEEAAAKASEKAAPKRRSVLEEYTVNLTALAKQGKLDPVVGRERELRRVIRILCRRTKNNPVLTGEPGVGKTAIAEALAVFITGENAPAALAGKSLLSLDVGSLVAGTEYRGQFEQRVKNIINECARRTDVILFIDEIHTIVGAGRGSGSLDAGNMLKPALSRGTMQCIGATTFAEYQKYFEKDAALERRFQVVPVEEPSLEMTARILEGIKGRYEEFHGVRYNSDAIFAAARLSHRYMSGRNMPDKAIDLLDEAGAMKKLQAASGAATGAAGGGRAPELLLVDGEDVRETLREITGLFAGAATGEDAAVLSLEKRLCETVLGQDEAAARLSRVVLRARAGISRGSRPQGAFLFLGQSGVGKTFFARTLAQTLYGAESALLRIDMSDYMEKHNISRLNGSPPGYVGYEEGGVLTGRVRRNPHCVVLLDEVEKAHRDVFNLFLQILEEGELEDNTGRKISFRQTIIIMTSNAGMSELFNQTQLGFGRGGTPDSRAVSAAATKAARAFFSQEFLNRLDDILVFKPLGEAEITRILELELDDLCSRLKDARGGYALEVSDAAKSALCALADWRKNGARELRRVVEEHVEAPVAAYILQNIAPGTVFSVGLDAAGAVRVHAGKLAAGQPAKPKTRRAALTTAVSLLACALLGLSACVSRAISAEEYYAIGMAYFDIGKFSEAETWLLRATQADRTMRASEYNLGRIAFEQGRYTEAAKHFEKIIKRDPKNVMTLKALAYTYIKMSKLENAEKTYETVLELEPESADEGYNYSLVLFALGKYAECEAVLQKYHYNLSDNKDTLLMLARSQKAQEKVEAADSYALWLEKNKDPQVRMEYAEILEAGGFFARAIDQLKSALGEMSADTAKLKRADVQFAYARLLLTADPDNADALKEFEAAISAGFNDTDAVKKLIADTRISKANKDAVQRLLDAGLKLPEPEKPPESTETPPQQSETPPAAP
jgi:ATP-dependent Clp protease ATP-binding subunit ClpC